MRENNTIGNKISGILCAYNGILAKLYPTTDTAVLFIGIIADTWMGHWKSTLLLVFELLTPSIFKQVVVFHAISTSAFLPTISDLFRLKWIYSGLNIGISKWLGRSWYKNNAKYKEVHI